MNIRQLGILVGGLVAAVCAVLALQLLSLPAARRGGISVRFVGFTNTPSGAILGQFTVSNAFRYKLICCGAAPQIRLTNGWSEGSHYGYPGNPVFTIAPHAAHTFAVALSNVDGAVWRVPLAYDKVQTKLVRWSQEIGLVFGLSPADHPGGYTNTPEIFGLSNDTAQRAAASRPVEETVQPKSTFPGPH